MSARLSVIFYIILCFEIGVVLTLLPWIPQGTLGLSDWGNNYFLLYAARKTGFYGLQTVVASGWVRGAVTGIGVLNLGIAFWEIFHFKHSVRALEVSASELKAAKDGTRTVEADHLSNHERQNDGRNDEGEPRVS
ncbi:MAG TPA: hypothetical protein VJ023_19025 [Pyrinomonadaceae bacterium]|nr:hypothetical protein [Pyrinomonadaceae bacterium]